MTKINKEESGWIIALSWLSALEETARDFHGTRPHVFAKRAYEHSVQHFIHRLGNEYGIRVAKADSIRQAVNNYIQLGIDAGLFRDASDFDLEEITPFRLSITVHNCKYKKSCSSLIEQGFSIRDLTCARIGCFRAAVKVFANIDCDYKVQDFDIDGVCKGYIERV